MNEPVTLSEALANISITYSPLSKKLHYQVKSVLKIQQQQKTFLPCAFNSNGVLFYKLINFLHISEKNVIIEEVNTAHINRKLCYKSRVFICDFLI